MIPDDGKLFIGVFNFLQFSLYDGPLLLDTRALDG
jgi:hypothetical protein